MLVKSRIGKAYPINDVSQFRSSQRWNPTISIMELFATTVEDLKLLSSRALIRCCRAAGSASGIT